MKITEEMLDHILGIQTIGEGVRLMKAYANEDPKIQKYINRVTYGIKKRFHYQRYENGLFIEKPKGGYVVMDGQKIPYEELWDEIDDRIALVQKVLLEHIQEEDIIEGR